MYTVDQTVDILHDHHVKLPPTCLVLGSGWDHILQAAKVTQEITYSDLFGCGAGVPGHAGKLILATLKGKRVALMAGRLHTYEGYSSEEVTRPLQVLARLGMRQIVLTAATGALNEKYTVGDFVVLSDIITMFCPSPLTGAQFVDLSQAFDPTLRQRALQICAREHLPYHEGIYVYTRGPHFETPADKMMFHALGADVVGMSMVPETIMAHQLGIKVLGLAYVTNLAFVKHDHRDVLAAAGAGGVRMIKLLEGIL